MPGHGHPPRKVARRLRVERARVAECDLRREHGAVVRLRLPRGHVVEPDAGHRRPGVLRQIVEGWRFVGTTPLIRGLVVGMLGAFGAGGFVIGVAPSFVADLDAG